MATLLTTPGRTFGEFVLLPDYGDNHCRVDNIDLTCKLHDRLQLGITVLSAAMTSVTGYEMALALAKEGGLGIIPCGLPQEDQVGIVRRIKAFEMGFVAEPIKIRENRSIEDALAMIRRFGHSKIPIVDVNNVYQGMFDLEIYIRSPASHKDPITTVLAQNVPTLVRSDLTIDEAKVHFAQSADRYLVILDNQGRLVKLAFKKDEERLKVGAATNTHDGWEQRARALGEAGVDLIVIDTADAHTPFSKIVLNRYNQLRSNGDPAFQAPICAGNVVTYNGALHLMNAGADMIKEGMSSGSICTSAQKTAAGRAPMTSLIEVCRARDFFKEAGRYVPIIADGGISDPASLLIALTHADACMMGGVLNRYLEAAGPKLDNNRIPTTDEHQMEWVETWGEASARAHNFVRYQHAGIRTFVEEGIEDVVPYCGRLKPGLSDFFKNVYVGFVRAGCRTLPEFRKRAVIELLSEAASGIVKRPHHVGGGQ